MLFVFPGLTCMTTFPPLFQPWPTAGKYHSTLFPTKPLSVSLPAGACEPLQALTQFGQPLQSLYQSLHPRCNKAEKPGIWLAPGLNPGPHQQKFSALPLWAIRTTLWAFRTTLIAIRTALPKHGHFEHKGSETARREISSEKITRLHSVNATQLPLLAPPDPLGDLSGCQFWAFISAWRVWHPTRTASTCGRTCGRQGVLLLSSAWAKTWWNAFVFPVTCWWKFWQCAKWFSSCLNQVGFWASHWPHDDFSSSKRFLPQPRGSLQHAHVWCRLLSCQWHCSRWRHCAPSPFLDPLIVCGKGAVCAAVPAWPGPGCQLA